MKQDTSIQTTGKYTYDAEHDLLIIKVDDVRYKRSVEQENLVLDLGQRDAISGIRIIDATSTLRIPKEVLSNVSEWTLTVDQKQGVACIRLLLKGYKRKWGIFKETLQCSQQFLTPIDRMNGSIQCHA